MDFQHNHIFLQNITQTYISISVDALNLVMSVNDGGGRYSALIMTEVTKSLKNIMMEGPSGPVLDYIDVSRND